MKNRRKSLGLIPKKTRDSLPINSQATITASQIQELEKKNANYQSQIAGLELSIQRLRQQNQQLEKQNKEPQSQGNYLEYINSLKAEVNQLTISINQIKQQNQIVNEQTQNLETQLAPLTQEYSELNEEKNSCIGLKAAISKADFELNKQAQEIQTLSLNLLELNDKLESLDGFKWVDQKKEIEKDIESGNLHIKSQKDEILHIKQQISELQQKQEFLKPIVEKWKGKKLPETTPIENVDELTRKLANKLKQPPPDTTDLEQHLQEIVQENERKRDQIAKEKKENSKRIRKIQQVLVEIKKQNRETHEKANIDEQRLVQRILALTQEDI